MISIEAVKKQLNIKQPTTKDNITLPELAIYHHGEKLVIPYNWMYDGYGCRTKRMQISGADLILELPSYLLTTKIDYPPKLHQAASDSRIPLYHPKDSQWRILEDTFSLPQPLQH